MGTSIQLGILRSCTNAERLAASFPGGSLVYEHDTGSVLLRATDGADALIWVLIAQSASDSVIDVEPAIDEELTVNLPDITTVDDGAAFTYVLVGEFLGAAVGVITPFGTDTVGMAGKWYRLYEGGTVTLRADVAAARWNVVGEDKGLPQDVNVSANGATGDDANPGTVALPVQTLTVALAIMAATDWYGQPTILAEDAFGDSNVTIPSSEFAQGAPLRILGSDTFVPLVEGVTCTAAGAGSAIAPLAWASLSYAATAELADDAGVGSYVRFTSGALVGFRYLIAESSNVQLRLTGITAAQAAGIGETFVVEAPSTELNISRVTGSGATPLLLDRVAATLSRVVGMQMYTRQSNMIVGLYETAAFAGLPNETPPFVSPTLGPIAGSGATLRVGGVNIGSIHVGTTNLALPPNTAFECGAILSQLLQTLSFTRQGSYAFTQCRNGTTFETGGVTVGVGAAVSFQTVHIVGTNGQSLSTFREGASGTVTGLTGTATAGSLSGLVAETGARVRVTDPNTGTTIAGASGAGAAVVVGGNAAASWATISGTPASRTDVGAVAPQLCYVGP